MDLQTLRKFMYSVSTTALDQLALETVGAKTLEPECGLFASKWWDYRHQHPVNATVFFAEAYKDAYRKMSVLRGGKDEIRTGVTDGKLFQHPPGTIKGLWKARQAADRIGCPYHVFTSFALDHLDRSGWIRLPRPNQLYSNDLLREIQAHWDDLQRWSLQTANDAYYLACNFDGDEVQLDYQNYLVEQCKRRHHSEYSVGTLINRGILVEQIAVDHFGAQVVERGKLSSSF